MTFSVFSSQAKGDGPVKMVVEEGWSSLYHFCTF